MRANLPEPLSLAGQLAAFRIVFTLAGHARRDV
jgi:hypothetical protein